VGGESGLSMAPCGINCKECGIYRATNDPEEAKRIADWFVANGTEVQPEQVRCLGCPGDREQHWSGNCEILACCIDEKGLELCHQCDDFVCDRLEDFAGKSDRYQEAVERLKGLLA